MYSKLKQKPPENLPQEFFGGNAQPKKQKHPEESIPCFCNEKGPKRLNCLEDLLGVKFTIPKLCGDWCTVNQFEWKVRGFFLLLNYIDSRIHLLRRSSDVFLPRWLLENSLNRTPPTQTTEKNTAEETAMRYSDEDFLKDSLELAKTAGIDEVGPLKMCVWGWGGLWKWWLNRFFFYKGNGGQKMGWGGDV